jgi:hypothetical protein
MKIKNLSLIGAIAAIIFTASCTKQEQLGPEIKSATKDFKFVQELTVTKTEFKNLTDKPDFEAKFNEKVSWKLRLIGLKLVGDKLMPSGAEKVFTGLSDGFDGNTIDWDARSSNIQFFTSPQKVATELTITGRNEIIYGDTFNLIYRVPYHNVVYNGIKHIVVDGFENQNIPSSQLDNLGRGKTPDANDTDVEFDRVNVRAVNGNFSYKMKGRDINRNSWSGDILSDFIFNFYRNVSSVNALIIDSGISPNELYFNLFIYGQGSSSAGVQIKVFELDSKRGGKTESIKSRQDIFNYAKAGSPDPSNSYSQAENDGYIYNVVVNWQGWKLVSIPYSEFRPNIDPLAGGNGDRKKESWRICGASLSLLSEPPGNLNEVYLDLFTITQKGKFQF